MEKPPLKLAIRFNVKEPEERETPPQEYVYRWDRIVGAVTVLVLVLAAFIWGGWYWLTKPVQTAPTPPVAASIPLVEVPTAEPVSIPVPKPEPVAEPPAVAEESDTAEAPSTEPEASAEEDLAEVLILSDHFTRAQLTNDVQHGEPIDHASAVIPMNEKGLIRVYLYTEMEGLQGRTLHHDWYLGDQRMARVTMRPRTANLRAYSSKFIDRHMLGNWRVEVHSSDGEPMARTAFEVH